jgi:uncharacterized protein (TIGR02001 family)
VTAPATPLGELRRGSKLSALLVGATIVAHVSPAGAQVGAATTIVSDNRFRGYSLSDGRPAGILDLSYDDPSGLYGTMSGSLVATRHHGLQPLGLLLNAGYAKRLDTGLTVDVGVTHSRYSRYSNHAAETGYTEVYASLSGKFMTGRIYVSPDYLEHGSLYGELNGSLPLASNLRLSGHAGLLVPFRRSSYEESYGRDVDWRIGIARQFGPLSLQAAWTAVRPGHESYRYGYHHRDGLVVSMTYAL